MAHAEPFYFNICGELRGPLQENSYAVVSDMIPALRCLLHRQLGRHDLLAYKVRELYALASQRESCELAEFPCFFHYVDVMPNVAEYQLITDLYLPVDHLTV